MEEICDCSSHFIGIKIWGNTGDIPPSILKRVILQNAGCILSLR
jgi:hypothetical protein